MTSFSGDLFDKVLGGVKTETRRESVKNLKQWKTRAITPGRGKFAPRFNFDGLRLNQPRLVMDRFDTKGIDPAFLTPGQIESILSEAGWERANIFIYDIKQEPLHKMTDVDAVNEGFTDLDHFIQGWDAIYKHRPDFQWKTNPTVYVVKFNLNIATSRYYQKWLATGQRMFEDMKG